MRVITVRKSSTLRLQSSRHVTCASSRASPSRRMSNLSSTNGHGHVRHASFESSTVRHQHTAEPTARSAVLSTPDSPPAVAEPVTAESEISLAVSIHRAHLQAPIPFQTHTFAQTRIGAHFCSTYHFWLHYRYSQSISDDLNTYPIHTVSYKISVQSPRTCLLSMNSEMAVLNFRNKTAAVVPTFDVSIHPIPSRPQHDLCTQHQNLAKPNPVPPG